MNVFLLVLILHLSSKLIFRFKFALILHECTITLHNVCMGYLFSSLFHLCLQTYHLEEGLVHQTHAWVPYNPLEGVIRIAHPNA